jgi:hypothetical protein
LRFRKYLENEFSGLSNRIEEKGRHIVWRD